MAYTKYSLTPANNTATPPDGAPEGMLPSAVNDTMRDMMAQIRDCGDGIRDGTYTMTAPKITGGTITGSTINNSAIGGTTTAAGAFTTLSATGVTTVQAGTNSAPAITTTGDTNTGIFFPAADTIAFTEGGVESMRIDSSGNVGIGSTTINNNKLLVKGTHAGGRSIAAVQTDQAATGSSVYLGFYNSSDSRIGIIGCDTATNMQIGAIENVPLTFATNNTERMRIDSSGNLLVGTTSTLDNSRLTVSQTGNNTCIAASTTSSGGSSVYRAVTSQTSMTAMVFLTSTSTTAGAISSSSTTTTYSTSSDYRLKENIAPMAGALAKIAQLKPVTYNWKSDGSVGQGFIAHELQAVVPDCVTGEKDAVETYTDEDGNEQTRPKYQGIDTSFLVATLTAAIQELKAQLDESNLILTSVKTELDATKAEVQALKAK